MRRPGRRTARGRRRSRSGFHGKVLFGANGNCSTIPFVDPTLLDGPGAVVEDGSAKGPQILGSLRKATNDEFTNLGLKEQFGLLEFHESNGVDVSIFRDLKRRSKDDVGLVLGVKEL